MNIKKYTIVLFILFITCFISCKADNNDNNNNNNLDITGSIGLTSGPETITPSASIPDFTIDNNELMIYTIDDPTSNNVVSVTAYVYEEDISPELVVDYVIESMEDAYYFIDVLEVSFYESTVIVDFSAETPPCQGVSLKIEDAILDSFAQSLVDNIDNCNKVIFKTEGEYYKSENKSFTNDYIHIESK